jgi:hypothetical protein
MEPLPIACSLGPTDQSSRRAEWQALMEEAVVETAPTPSGVVMQLVTGRDAQARIERLIALERDCCAWIEWTLRDDGAHLTVEATSDTGAGAAVLQGWFAPTTTP